MLSERETTAAALSAGVEFRGKGWKRDKGTQRDAKMLCSTTYMCLDHVHDFREMIFGVNMKLKVFNKRQALPSQHNVLQVLTQIEKHPQTRPTKFFC